MIDGIYATAADHHDWSGLLGQVAEFVGAKSAMMGVSDVKTGFSEPNLTFFGLDEAFIHDRWRTEFGFRDVWAEQGYAPQEAEVLTGAQLLRLDSLKEDPFYGHVLKPLGIEDCLVTSLSTSGSRVVYMSLYQDVFEGAFEGKQKDRLRALSPHLVRAAKLETMLQESRIEESIQAAALDELSMAVLSVSEGVAKPLNLRAEEMLSEGTLLSIRKGQLSTADPDADERLKAGIAAAGGTSLQPNPPTATAFGVRRSPGEKLVVGWCVPVRERRRAHSSVLSLLSSPRSALVFLADSGGSPHLTEDIVSALFGLTRSEARIAIAIAAGETPAEYAERAGVTIHTARWTVKQVQAKLGVRRQLDIAALLIRAVPSLRDRRASTEPGGSG